jgi:hypothetical protein
MCDEGRKEGEKEVINKERQACDEDRKEGRKEGR